MQPIPQRFWPHFNPKFLSGRNQSQRLTLPRSSLAYYRRRLQIGSTPVYSQNYRGYAARAHEPEKELLKIDEEESHLSSEELGRKKLLARGFDPESLYEQKIVWGDLDSFRHVNNVRYVRFLESARIVWMQSVGQEIGGPERAANMIAGKGVSLILKDIAVRFRRPVLYPDTLLIAHRPHDPHPTHFSCAAAIWSYSQRTIVATSDSTLVWYDYDTLKKCDPGLAMHAVLQRRIDLGLQGGSHK